MLNYTIEHEWNAESSKAVIEGLQNFNVSFIGKDNPQKLSIIVRNGEGEIVAGLLAETKWNWMYIGCLWVAETYRAQGIGKELMRSAEDYPPGHTRFLMKKFLDPKQQTRKE